MLGIELSIGFYAAFVYGGTNNINMTIDLPDALNAGGFGLILIVL